MAGCSCVSLGCLQTWVVIRSFLCEHSCYVHVMSCLQDVWSLAAPSLSRVCRKLTWSAGDGAEIIFARVAGSSTCSLDHE